MSWLNKLCKPLLEVTNPWMNSCFQVVESTNSNFIYKAINDIPGLSAVKPKAILYIFKIDHRDMYRVDDDEQFVLEFLKRRFSWFMAAALTGKIQITSDRLPSTCRWS